MAYVLSPSKQLGETSDRSPIDSNWYSQVIPEDYSNLLNLKDSCCQNLDKDSLYLEHVVVNRYRNPIAFFIYKKNFYLQVYRMCKFNNTSISNFIKLNYGNANKPYNALYSLDIKSSIKYEYKSTAPITPNLITLKIDGVGSRINFENDSLIYLSSNFRELSIQINQSQYDDMYACTKKGFFSFNVQPLELLFLRRNGFLYLITLSSFKSSQNMSDNLLRKIISTK